MYARRYCWGGTCRRSWGGGGCAHAHSGCPPFSPPSLCRYPKNIADALPDDGRSNVLFVHFCIRDFSVVAPESMLEVVREVSRLVVAGHVLVVHCLGGHGRFVPVWDTRVRARVHAFNGDGLLL